MRRLGPALPLLAVLALLGGCSEQGCGGKPPPQRVSNDDGGKMRPNLGDSRGPGIKFSDVKDKVSPLDRKPRLLQANASPQPKGPAKTLRVIRRRVDGIADRVEMLCPVEAGPAECHTRPEIKARCCPEGIVERCTAGLSGLHVIGRGCDSAVR